MTPDLLWPREALVPHCSGFRGRQFKPWCGWACELGARWRGPDIAALSSRHSSCHRTSPGSARATVPRQCDPLWDSEGYGEPRLPRPWSRSGPEQALGAQLLSEEG